ncbi:glutaredoxin family protein [Flavobacterium sp.]|uniref:glutaredoxin family protein n=1 Tax=Flavobacterium sp. TaxID=239 RepID=UPI0038CFB26D
MADKIVVFTLDGCRFCIDLKKELKKSEIPFNEIEISNNQSIWDKVVEQTGHNLLPTVYINKEGTDEGPVYVPSRDFNSPKEIIEIIKTIL